MKWFENKIDQQSLNISDNIYNCHITCIRMQVKNDNVRNKSLENFPGVSSKSKLLGSRPSMKMLFPGTKVSSSIEIQKNDLSWQKKHFLTYFLAYF